MITPLTICSYPSCRAVAIEHSRCSVHQREATVTHDKPRNSTTRNNDIYQSTKWRKLRARKAKANPICEECLTYNVIKPLDVVDHVKEILDYPELAYTFSNLRSLCHSCHNAKTAKAKADRTKPTTMSANDLFNKLRK
ncbi:HNH endonuclease [Vibrio fortis]|uniref:HNH endonuclease n=1 Tax=Vibrio fortis TaxID=212667 RepID=UPI0038CD3D3E